MRLPQSFSAVAMNVDETIHAQDPSSHFHIIRNVKAYNQTKEGNFFSTSGHKQVVIPISRLHQEKLHLGIKTKLLEKLTLVSLPTAPMS